MAAVAVLMSALLLCFLFDANSSLFHCPFYLVTGIECPGCGLQRSLVLLFAGSPIESLRMYWATVPILFLFGYCLFFLKYRNKNGPRNLLYLFSVISVLIFCNYLFKLIYPI